MIQFFSHYKEWEDYNNGMYQTKVSDPEELINESKKLLCNPVKFKLVAFEVIKKWPVSTKVNLTAVGSGKRSWLGQAACCFQCKAPEHLVRVAWSQMDTKQRDEANEVADELINEWQESYKSECQKSS